MATAIFEFVDGTEEHVTVGGRRYRELLEDGHAPVGSTPASDGISDPLQAYLSATYAGIGKVAPRTTVALMGTSITAQNSPLNGFDAVGGTHHWDALGYWTHANYLTRNRLTYAGDYGVGGNTTAQMLARFDADILGLSPVPGILVLEPGPNDAGAGGLTAAQSIANITAILEKATAAGMRVVLGEVTPSSYISSTAAKQARALVNQWIRDTAPTLFPGVVPALWAGPLTAAAGGPDAAFFQADGGTVHPNNRGAFRMGKVLASALATLAPIGDPLPNDPANPYIVSDNPWMIGGSGSTLPTSYSALDNSGAALSGSVATVASTDDLSAQWAQMTVTAGTGRLYVRGTGGAFAVGDVVEAMCEFETDATGWAGSTPRLRLNCVDTLTGGTLLQASQSVSSRSADGDLTDRPSSGVMRTPKITIPANTNRLQLEWIVKGASVSRVRRLVVRKVV